MHLKQFRLHCCIFSGNEALESPLYIGLAHEWYLLFWFKMFSV